jgi:vacuolar-type H+-ATPase subunit H
MREVIKNVIATEAEARGMVAAARAEADRITSDAQKRSQEMVAQARLEARAEAERLVEAARREAEREKQEQLARATVEIETQVRLEQTNRHRAVAGAVRCVCGQLQDG